MKRYIKIYLLAFALVLLLTACGAPSAPPAAVATPEEQANTPTWQEQYDLGLRLFSEGNYEEAIIAFTAAIEIDPKQAPAYVARGDAYLGSGETADTIAQAKIDYEAALELDNQLTAAWLGIVDVYIRMGDYEKALELAKEGFALTGDEGLDKKIKELESGNINDAQGRIRRMTSYDGDGALVFYHEYTYRNDGKRDVSTSYDANGNQTGVVVLEYNAEGKATVGFSYYYNDGIIFTIENSYNEDGTMAQSIRYDADGSVRGSIIFGYDEQGNQSEIREYDEHGNPTIRSVSEYNAAGQTVRYDRYQISSNGNESLFAYHIYEYNAAGQLTIENIFKPDGTLRSRDVYEYNDEGYRIGYTVYNGAGEVQQVYEYSN